MNDDFNPYAAPKSEIAAWPAETEQSGVWRDGRLLVMTKDAELPDRCLKCNAPAYGWRLRRKLSWHPPGWYALILVHLLLYILVALIVRKTAKVAFPLCPDHRRDRAQAIAVGWIAALIGIGLFVAGVVPERPLVAALIGGLLLTLFGLLYGLLMSRVAVPTRIDDRFVWLKNVHPVFLLQLPPRL